jgi:hypothetical protein
MGGFFQSPQDWLVWIGWSCPNFRMVIIDVIKNVTNLLMAFTTASHLCHEV